MAKEGAVDGGTARAACPPPELIGRPDGDCDEDCSASALVTEGGMWGVGICINGAAAGSVAVACELGGRDRGLPDAEAALGDKERLDSFIPMSANAEVTPWTWEGPGLLMGWFTFVDKYMMSLP